MLRRYAPELRTTTQLVFYMRRKCGCRSATNHSTAKCSRPHCCWRLALRCWAGSPDPRSGWQLVSKVAGWLAGKGIRLRLMQYSLCSYGFATRSLPLPTALIRSLRLSTTASILVPSYIRRIDRNRCATVRSAVQSDLM